MNEMLPHLVSLLAGGGFVAVVNALANRSKTRAETENMSIKSLLEVDERMSNRMTSLETRLAAYEEKNAELRGEILELKAENHRLQLELERMEVSINGSYKKKETK
ncbi:MAG: hypothetical protein FWD45_00300 [Coriobacteriia bacterium]|nr:hypothetical protein [Coriobacteriia bacterium]